jgi:hypothetical protein
MYPEYFAEELKTALEAEVKHSNQSYSFARFFASHSSVLSPVKPFIWSTTNVMVS